MTTSLPVWLNFVGLVLDLLGILMLAREWWIAASYDAREADLETMEERRRPNPMMPQPEGLHHEVHADMRRRQDFARRMQRRRASWAARRVWFVASFFFILTGYALQIVASLPVTDTFP